MHPKINSEMPQFMPDDKLVPKNHGDNISSRELLQFWKVGRNYIRIVLLRLSFMSIIFCDLSNVMVVDYIALILPC